VSLGGLAQDIQLADICASDPTFKRIKDKSTALRLMKQKAKQREMEMDSYATVQNSGVLENEVYLGNSIDIMSTFTPRVFHACITDPPWSQFHDHPELTRDDDTIIIFKEIYRVLREDSFLLAFVPVNDFCEYHKAFKEFGFDVQDVPLIWHKKNVVSQGRRAWETNRDHEEILLAVKGNPCLVIDGARPSVLDYPAIHGSLLKHPNEKPIELMKYLVKEVTHPNAMILDPFAGSGSTLDAAKQLGRRYVGIEREYGFYKKILKRLGKDDI
jgi:site-specific DNA-methyltransferase (adenine-specific)